jgi:hypothetical protein
MPLSIWKPARETQALYANTVTHGIMMKKKKKKENKNLVWLMP